MSRESQLPPQSQIQEFTAGEADIESPAPLQLISPVTGFAGAISGAMGVGILALGQAFQRGSLVVALVLCVVCHFLSLSASQMFLESAARYWYVKRGKYVLPDDCYVSTATLCRELPKKRTVGLILSITFQFCNVLYLFATLLETCSVAAKAITAEIPLKSLKGLDCSNPSAKDFPAACNKTFWVTIIILTSILMIISFFDLRKLGWLFNIYLGWRVCVILSLIGFCSYQIHHEGVSDSVHYTKTDMRGFAFLTPAVVFAFIWQAAIGVVYEPIRNKPKTLSKMFSCLTLAMSIIYILVGTLSQLAFGIDTDSTVTKNIHRIPMGNNFVRFLSQIAILYGPFCYLSTCPLISHPFATALLEWGPKQWRKRKVAILCARAVAIWVPAIIAGFLRNFDIINDISGIGSYLIMLVYPPLLMIFSKDLSTKKDSPYSRWWIGRPTQIALLVFGIFFPIVTICYM